MKIAMVTEYLAPKELPRFGGVDARTINLARCLATDNDVHIITAHIDGGRRVEQFDGVTIHRVGAQRRFTQRGDFLQRLKFNRQVVEKISSMQPDVVDGSGFVSYAGCYKAAERISVPSVATIHEVWQGEWIQNMGFVNGFAGHFLEKQYLGYNFDGYTSVSVFTKKKLVEKLGIDEEKIAVIYNGIDLDLYKKTTVDEKFPNTTVVTVCRLVPYKRVDDLLRAIQLLESAVPDINLKIVGSGPQKDYLQKLSKKLDIEHKVDFLGRINDTRDLIKVLKKSHVFALPSIVEGFGMVVIEAMAADIPYVASDIPPIREVTDGGIGGLLCKPKNHADLAEKLRLLLTDNSGRFYTMDTQRREHVKKFEWDALAYKMKQWYNTLCGGMT
ncbi:MAG: glycosyltransferase family 4 protein [Candidatus Thermoplasmatota archaeon]|nr:glycosyltransferase family 4 protein [Candidatus Thermoplasmatota archaeon]